MNRPAAACVRALLLLALTGGLNACAPRVLRLPQGPGEPFPDFRQAFAAATAACRGVRTLTAEAAVSGKVGSRRLRGRVIVGFERPGRIRLEGVAPIGAPVFILAADVGNATLLMPRAGEVLRGEPTESVLEALIGVSLRPDDLEAILVGCVAPDPTALDGRRYGGGWARVDLEGGSVAYLRQEHGAWRVRAGSRPLLMVEYEFESQADAVRPQVVRLRSTANGGPGGDLRLALSQVEMNVPIADKAFTVAVPSGAVPITLAELRQAGPLGERQ